jgi:hypothetical protein
LHCHLSLFRAQGTSIVNPKNADNRKHLRQLRSLVQDFESELQEWDEVTRLCSTDSVEAAENAAIALDDGEPDEEALEAVHALETAAASLKKLADSTQLSVGAIAAASRSAHAVSLDAEDLVKSATAAVHSAAFKSTGAESAQDLVRGMTQDPATLARALVQKRASKGRA